MLTSKQRIENCVKTFGIDERQATRIFKDSEDLLSIEELRMKYENTKLGIEYPEWLTPTDHLKICFKTAKDMYSVEKFGWFCEEPELANMLFIWSSLRLNKFDNHALLKCACVRACKNILRDNVIRSKYVAGSMDAIYNNGEYDYNLYNIMDGSDSKMDEIELLTTINSLKNNVIRGLLIVCGYVIAGIDGFEIAYREFVATCDKTTQAELAKILDRVHKNEQIMRDKKAGKYVTEKVKKVTIKNVAKALGIQTCFLSSFKDFAKDYILKREILN